MKMATNKKTLAKIEVERFEDTIKMKIEGAGGELLRATEDIIVRVVLAVSKAENGNALDLLGKLFEYAKERVEDGDSGHEPVDCGADSDNKKDDTEEFLELMDGIEDLPDDLKKEIAKLRKIRELKQKVESGDYDVNQVMQEIAGLVFDEEK